MSISLTHWNIQNIQPKDPVTLGLCSQRELDAVVAAVVVAAVVDAAVVVAAVVVAAVVVVEVAGPPVPSFLRIICGGPPGAELMVFCCCLGGLQTSFKSSVS